MNKKLIAIVVILIALVLAGIIAFTLINKQNESMPDIESIETVTEEVKTENADTNNEVTTESEDEAVVDESAANKDAEKVSVIKKVADKVNAAKKAKTEAVEKTESTVKNETKTTVKKAKKTSKFTEEEEELLKKVPRSEEVVVDKEIKVKSSGKYLFK